MTRRPNPPSHRPPGSARGAPKDRATIDSELRAARAKRKAASQQKQALRRLEWDQEVPDVEEDEDDTGMFEDVPSDEEPPEAKAEVEEEEKPKKKPRRS